MRTSTLSGRKLASMDMIARSFGPGPAVPTNYAAWASSRFVEKWAFQVMFWIPAKVRQSLASCHSVFRCFGLSIIRLNGATLEVAIWSLFEEYQTTFAGRVDVFNAVKHPSSRQATVCAQFFTMARVAGGIA